MTSFERSNKDIVLSRQRQLIEVVGTPFIQTPFKLVVGALRRRKADEVTQKIIVFFFMKSTPVCLTLRCGAGRVRPPCFFSIIQI